MDSTTTVIVAAGVFLDIAAVLAAIIAAAAIALSADSIDADETAAAVGTGTGTSISTGGGAHITLTDSPVVDTAFCDLEEYTKKACHMNSVGAV